MILLAAERSRSTGRTPAMRRRTALGRVVSVEACISLLKGAEPCLHVRGEVETYVEIGNKCCTDGVNSLRDVETPADR